MLNDLKTDRGIAYINDVPYMVRNTSVYDIVRLGNRGEKIDYAVVFKDGIHKIVNGCYFYKQHGSENDFELKADNIVGGVYRDSNNVFVFRSYGAVENVIADPSAEDRKVPILWIDGIKDVYNIVPTRYCILRDNNNKLVFWSSAIPSASTGDYKGNQIKLHTFDTRSPVPGSEHVVFLTDETLYSGRPSDGFETLSFPNNVSPDDIKDIQVVAEANIFLLTNDGKVYSIGKNGYNQRGTAKKVKPGEWNQIEYPEPIKQIAAGTVPGLFALSENGDLYYHGYNEGGYYPVTGRKSNISKPMKIIDNVNSLWMVRIYGRRSREAVESGNMLLFLDNEGVLKRLMDRRDKEDNIDVLKEYPSMIPSNIYKKLTPDLVMNKEMMSAFMRYNCV